MVPGRIIWNSEWSVIPAVSWGECDSGEVQSMYLDLSEKRALLQRPRAPACGRANSQLIRTSFRLRVRSLLGRTGNVVRSEVHVVLQTDLRNACHRVRQRERREGLLLIGAGHRIEERLVQLSGNAEHAARFRRSVVES